MSQEPGVSICVPVFNGEEFLAETLDSIVRQTYPHREIIVADNASTDRTPEIVKTFMRDHPIRHERSETFLELSEENCNRCINLAQNNLVCIYHDDDVYEPDIVARCAGVMTEHPEVGAVFTMARVIDERGREVSRYRLPGELKRLNKTVFHLDEIFKAVLKNENSFLVCPSVMLRKSVIERLGGWEHEHYRFTSDLGLWFKIARDYPVAIIDEPLVRYRISPQQGSQRITRERTERDGYLKVIEDFMPQINTDGFEKYYWASCIKDLGFRALNLSAAGNIPESRTLARQAIKEFWKRARDVWSIRRAVFWFIVSLFLSGINALPFGGLRRCYCSTVVRLLNLKKKVIAY